ncbi:MAG: hypothetical protein ACRELC_12370 [Gemmatimonadota bacterium]
MKRIAAAHRATCERSGLLRPVCPRSVPRGSGYGASLYIEPDLDVFTLGRGADHPAHPELDRPPGFLHVVAVAGAIERLASFRDPRTRRVLRDGFVREDRSRPFSFGRVRWGGRSGAFVLMPSWPGGGMLGNHLVFSWREQRRDYALSLHAWEPLTEAAAALRAMVESLPSLANARRIARLSPVRRIALARGQSTAQVRIPAPPPARHAYDVSVVARAGADLGIELRTPNGSRLHVFDSIGVSDCRVRAPYRLCYLRFARLPEEGGTWRIVVRKRSLPPTTVRVDVLFEDR